MTVAVVYIAPSAHAKANANEPLGRLRDTISELLTKHLDRFLVVAGDFNHTSLKAVRRKHAGPGVYKLPRWVQGNAPSPPWPL